MPDHGVHKVNTDASLEGDLASIVGVIRNHAGSFISAFSLNVDAQSIHGLELQAVQKGIMSASRLQLTRIWLESDSLFVVRIIEGKLDCPWKQWPLLAKIWALLTPFEDWKISHIWREGNAVTNFLSKRSFQIKNDVLGRADIPSDVVKPMELDASGMLYDRL
ncbi:uncharacterized protein LOC143882999 [Tasmannia lanceolata]|uniref:uncharacterized protein LOC143882999 n=1 Tax=Tasmannia lanceolata TaxID=3420 RepID=UPI0040647C8D